MKRIYIVLLISVLSTVNIAAASVSSNSLPPFLTKQLARVHSIMELEAWSEARTMLEDLRESTNNPYAGALIDQSLGQLAIYEENMQEALSFFISAYAAKTLKEEASRQLLHSIAQLHCVVEEWLPCREKMLTWISTSNQAKASDYMVVAQAYAETESWTETIPAIQNAIMLEQQVPESWYQLLVAAYANLSLWQEAINAQLIVLGLDGGSAEQWRRLVSLHMQNNDYRQALSAMRIPFEQGILNTEKDYRKMAQLLFQEGIPLRAASLMNDGLNRGIVRSTQNTLQFMASLWVEAKGYDEAISLYYRLIQIEPRPKWYKQIAVLHFQQKEWLEASEVLQNVTKARELFDLELMLGVALINLKHFDEAKVVMKNLVGQHSVSDQAASWLRYIEQLPKA